MVAKRALLGLTACAVLALFTLMLIPSASQAGEGIAAEIDSIPMTGAAAWDAEVWIVNASADLPSIPIAERAVHSDWTNGVDVEAIRNCYDGGNPVFQLWREPDKTTYHCFFQLPDGRLGDRIIAKDHKGWYERTAFVPKDGTWRAILDWLTRKGATRYTGPIK